MTDHIVFLTTPENTRQALSLRKQAPGRYELVGAEDC